MPVSLSFPAPPCRTVRHAIVYGRVQTHASKKQCVYVCSAGFARVDSACTHKYMVSKQLSADHAGFFS